MGQVENVSVETDPAFDRALKAAVQRGGSDPDTVLNALVEELEITAPLRFSISGLGSGSAGQQGLDVVFQSGTNPNAAANNAATAWLPILRGLEGNGGAYSARASLVEVNGGYILAIGVKVEQPGEEDEPDPVTLTGIVVTQNPTKITYISGESFNPAGMTVSEVYSDGTKTAVTDYTYSTAPLTKDTTEVTISYGGRSTTVKVEVLDTEDSYQNGTYSIATADGLLAWNETVQSDLSLNCTLTENINMMDKEWTPIGNSFQTYNGTFDGQGYSITGLKAPSLFGGIGESATVKNLQLVDVELYESGGATAGIVVNNYGTIMACSMTGEISAYSYTNGIANFNLGTIVACWFSGTLKGDEGYGIVAFNYGTITACFWDGNTTNGYRSNEGGTVEATKVDDSTVTWQTAINDMNAALTNNDYQWKLGADSLPVLQKK